MDCPEVDMKKLLSIILAAAAVLTMGTAAYAEETAAAKAEPATFTFDTDASMKYVHTFGNAADTNLTCELSDTGAISGRCLKLSEDFSSEVGNQYGGIYFDASDFGLDSFAGYTMKINIKTNAKSAKAASTFLVFSDGEQWVSENVLTADTGKWITATVSVPADKQNSKMGLSIPITSAFSGDVALIDDITITDNYGKAIANMGDVDTSLAEAPNGVVSVLTTILFILLIIVVVLGVGFVIMKVFRRFR